MIHYDDEVSRRSLGVPRRGRHTLVIENHYEFLVRASKCKIFDNFPYFGRFRTLHANNSGKRRLAAALRVSRALAGPQQPQRRPLLAYGWSMTVFSLTAQVNKHRNKNHCREHSEADPGTAEADRGSKKAERRGGPFSFRARDPVRC